MDVTGLQHGACHALVVTTPMFETKLRSVQEIQAARVAFTATQEDQSVVQWRTKRWWQLRSNVWWRLFGRSTPNQCDGPGFKSSTKCWKKQLFGSPKNQPISTRNTEYIQVLWNTWLSETDCPVMRVKSNALIVTCRFHDSSAWMKDFNSLAEQPWQGMDCTVELPSSLSMWLLAEKLGTPKSNVLLLLLLLFLLLLLSY